MAEEKKHYFSRVLIKLMMIVPSLFGLVTNCISIVEEEIQLAKKNLFAFVIVCLMIGTIITSTWICFLGIIFYLFIILKVNVFISLLFVILINLFLLFGCWLALVKIKNNIAFPRSADLLRDICKFKWIGFNK